MEDNKKKSNTIPQFLIAAPTSNSGKTTVTLGLINLLKRRGLNIRPFKCGPDYLDTQLHQLAADTESINLDLFMSSEEHVSQLYSKYTRVNDAAIVEGVMGLFDGSVKRIGSSADIARLLNIPVILIIDARSVAYSVAPLIYGFKNFDPEVNLAGVIFNFVNSESHFSFLKDACQDVGVHAYGYIPKNESFSIGSRHLGLKTDASDHWTKTFDDLGDHLEKHVNIDLLLKSTSFSRLDFPQKHQVNSNTLKIAVAKDEAFGFTYHENLEALKRHGEIIYFSPIHDENLPKADMLYFCGGYPELHLEQLSSNRKLLKEIQRYCADGGKAFAECGGMMYLGKSIKDSSGQEFPMVGVFPFKTSMLNTRLKLGYRKFFWDEITCRGHEFHYSVLENDSSVDSIGQFYNSKDIEVDTKFYQFKNTFASYLHAYWGEEDELLSKMLKGKKIS